MTKILYVEDNEDNIYMLTRRLKKKGFEIVIANLPELDGWEATRLIKAGQETNQIPVIALSAHAMKEHMDKALKEGCDDYDTKPVDIKRLLKKISKFLDT